MKENNTQNNQPSQKTYSLINTLQLKEDIVNQIDATDFLTLFGATITSVTNSEIRSTCPLHGGDNPTAFLVKTHRGGEKVFKWTCYTGCEDNHGDIISFVMNANNMTFKEAAQWLMSYVGMGTTLDSYIYNDTMQGIHSMKDVGSFNFLMSQLKPRERTEVPKEINENFVKECRERSHSYFPKRGYPQEILDKFEVGFCPAHLSPWTHNRHRARLIIPLRDEHGKLVGISGRVISDELNVKDKYNIIKGSNKANILYGLHLARPYIQKSGSVLIVEGFTDVWRCWQYGKYNVVAICGKDATPEQIRLILSNAFTVAVALDGDKSGQKGADKIQNAVIDYTAFYRVDIPQGRDIGDLSREEFYDCLKKARKLLDKVPENTNV